MYIYIFLITLLRFVQLTVAKINMARFFPPILLNSFVPPFLSSADAGKGKKKTREEEKEKRREKEEEGEEI